MQRMGPDGNWTTVATPPANTVSLLDSNLTPQTTYGYRVCATNSAGSSDWSNVASATTPASGGAVYLRDLHVANDCVVGSGSTTGVVTLSERTPTDVTVALSSADGSVSVPSSVTIPAGGLSTAFSISATAGTDPSATPIYAASGGWTQKAKIHLVPSSAAFAIASAGAQAGNGGVWVGWSPVDPKILGNGVVGYRVLRSVSGGAFQDVLGGTTDSPTFVDVSAPTGVPLTYRVQLVDAGDNVLAAAPDAAVAASPGAADVNWESGPAGTVSGSVSLNASLPETSGQAYCLYVDGLAKTCITPDPESTASDGSLVVSLDTRTLANGTHTLILASTDGTQALHASPPQTITVSNATSALSMDRIACLYDAHYDEVATTLPPGTTSYTVTLTDASGATVRTWTGTGASAKVVWDGRDASGNVEPYGDYPLNVTPMPGPGQPVGPTGSVKWLVSAPEFLAITTTDPFNTQAGIDYGNFIEQAVQALCFNDNFFTYCRLTFSKDYSLSSDDRSQIADMLRLSVAYFYLQGHGGTRVNDYYHPFTGYVGIGANMGLTNGPDAVFDSGTDGGIQYRTYVYSVPRLLKDQSPGRYQFVFLDLCGTAGYRNKNLSAEDEFNSEMSPYPNTVWAQAFSMDLIDGMFMGWNGKAYFPAPTGVNQWWQQWEHSFWTGLSQGMSGYEAINYAGQSLPSYAPDPNPRSVSNTYGSKLIFTGDKDNDWP